VSLSGGGDEVDGGGFGVIPAYVSGAKLATVVTFNHPGATGFFHPFRIGLFAVF
jgi:hypothetical protein